MTNAQRLYETVRKFDGSKFTSEVNEMIQAFKKGDDKAFEAAFAKLPTDIQLYDQIIERVKGKSVEKNLKATIKVTKKDITEQLIAVSSLMTHVAIECKRNKEYRALLPDLHNKIDSLIRLV